MKLLDRVTQVRPLVFLLAYLAAIPLFGLVYRYAVPSGFYAPYARFEPGGAEDTAGLAAGFEAAVRQGYAARGGANLVVDNWRYDLATLRVFHLESIDGEQVTFMLRIDAFGLGELRGARKTGETFRVVVPEHPTLHNPEPADITYRYPQIDLQNELSPMREHKTRLFQALLGEPDPLVAAPMLALDEDLEARYVRFLRGFRGDALAVSGQLGRMCYLSAEIITTLGLGEIVPITAPARGLVAAEAVLGIVFAGLFLNALAFRASNPRTDHG